MGIALSPAYLLMAHHYDAPGLAFRLRCAGLGLRLLYNRVPSVSFANIYSLIFWPMDSTRYFEFDFMWEALSKFPISRYLDVSSPRLFPVILALTKGDITAELLNPDPADVGSTSTIVEALGLKNRCSLHQCLITAAPWEAQSFDAITSISVVEHILQDTEAVQMMWDLLRPGGKMLLTLPCAAQASDQYINRNEYGLLTADDEGWFFFQRLYDLQLLEERIYSVTGQPHRRVIYGEKIHGTLRRNLDRKMCDPHYPYWREPCMMGQDFRYFEDLGELPGEGVIALEFNKVE